MNPSDPSPTLPSALYTESDLPPTLPGLLDAESGLSGSWRTPLDQLDLLERERPAQATPWLYRQAILLAGLWAVLLTTLALALAKELSGEAQLERVHQQQAAVCDCGTAHPTKSEAQIYVETTEQRFTGVRRCC